MRNSLAPDLVVDWRNRLSALQFRVEKAPDDQNVWRWRIEAKILRFLLRRYSETAFVASEISPMKTIFPISLPRPRATLSPAERLRHLENIATICRQSRRPPSFWLQIADDYLQSSTIPANRQREKRQSARW